ncbi:phytoene desaturase family protein [Planococcus maritimus]|uniref:phytoene desaturase family protein n=1 Tax=Planococcus maritimus TaxID=192421 RepID=UPI0007948ED5|nr:phytoene desaturase family protein [Planococcus maritimus]KYG59809.1 phytoene desaturase [Planococcus maritimus]
MKIAMIGGGIGGLMGALYLTKLGYEVTIYEKEHKLGGRMAFVERDGFRIDEGPTIVLLPEMFRDLFAQAGIDPESIELLLCDPLYTIRFTDGKVYTKYPGRERQLQEVEEQFPDDKEGFIRFMDEGQKRFDIGKPAFLEHDFVRKADFWTFRNIRNLMKLKPQQSVHRLMENYFRDERLQLAYSLQALYIGGDPYRAPAMYSLVPFSEHEHGVYYVKGGYASIIPVMEGELRSRGTDIRLETPVQRIVKENGRATAVETAQGTEEYDAIVYNGDFPGMNQLAPTKKQKEYTPSSGCVLLYFGLDKVYKDVNVHQFFIGDDYKEHMEDVFVREQKTENPAFYTFHPSVIDDSLAPEGKSVLYVLVPVPSGTEIDWEQDEEWIGRILDRMETLSFPNLRKSIEWMDVRTPKEAEAFGLFKGGSFGIGPTLRQSGVFRPQVKPDDTDNLYAVGASVHPGGGIPIVMQGAKLLADRIHGDLKEGGGS